MARGADAERTGSPPPEGPAPSASSGESLGWGVAISAWAFAAMALARMDVRAWQPPFDFAPLYLGAHALQKGLDPADRGVHALIWEEVGSGRAPGEWFNPYPATASLVVQPLALGRTWAEVADPFRLAMFASIVGTALVIGWLPGPSRSARVAAAGLAAFAAAKLGALQHALVIGQVSPLVVLLATLGAVAIVTGRDAVAALAIGLGGGLKVLPLVLLPAALRRPRALAGVAGVLALLAIGVWWRFPAWDPVHDFLRAWHQVTIGQATSTPGLGGLWHLRGPVAAVVITPLLLALLRHTGPRARAASAGLCLSAGGVVTGGLIPPHEAVLALPALVFHVGWLAMDGWRPLPVVTALTLAILPATPLLAYPEFELGVQDHALWLLVGVFAASVARAGVELRALRGAGASRA